MYDSALAHTANFSETAVEEVYCELLMTDRLWSPKAPHLNPCNYYLWGTLKDRVYVKNPHSVQKLKCNTETEIACISN